MEQAMLQDGNGTANQLESEASVGSGNSGLSGVPVTEQMLSQTLPFRLVSYGRFTKRYNLLSNKICSNYISPVVFLCDFS